MTQSVPVLRSSSRDAASTDAEVWPPLGGPVAGCRVLNTSLGTGVALGTTRTGKPVSIQLLRPSPVRVVVVAQAWVASLLAIRATAFGATTFIVTQRPAPWSLLVRSLGGEQPFASVVTADGLTLPTPSVAEPVCTMIDGAIGSLETGIARGPWQTSLHLIYRLSPASSSLIDTADLVLVPQPPEDELDAAVELLRLPPAIGARIARMQSGEVLAVTRSRAMFVTIAATATEAAVLRSR